MGINCSKFVFFNVKQAILLNSLAIYFINGRYAEYAVEYGIEFLATMHEELYLAGYYFILSYGIEHIYR